MKLKGMYKAFNGSLAINVILQQCCTPLDTQNLNEITEHYQLGIILEYVEGTDQDNNFGNNLSCN